MLGIEIDAIEPVAGSFSGVMEWLEIVKCTQHPNADRLRLCKVNNGNEIISIVCGGQNARSGTKVALATIGAEVAWWIKNQTRKN